MSKGPGKAKVLFNPSRYVGTKFTQGLCSRNQARPWFCLTRREFIDALIYLGHGSDRASMAVFFFLTLREFIDALIYPGHGSRGLGMAKVLFNL